MQRMLMPKLLTCFAKTMFQLQLPPVRIQLQR
jgi:hypothetical protein